MGTDASDADYDGIAQLEMRVGDTGLLIVIHTKFNCGGGK